jgi:hypothetical protein
MPVASPGTGPERSAHSPAIETPTTYDTIGAAEAAPNSDRPCRSCATDGRIVLVARFSNAARVTRETAAITNGR